MARRMFSPKIVCSDAFLDMPISTQALYFHLGMEADDDGFVNPKRIMRMVGASDDDLKVLVGKRFVLPFANGVVVIKHWRINNLIKGDRYHETVYTDEKKRLKIKVNGSYTEGKKWNHVGTIAEPQVRLGKVRLGKDRIGEGIDTSNGVPLQKLDPKFSQEGADVIKAFEEVDPKNKTYYGNTTQRKAADFLVEEYGYETVLKIIKILPQSNRTDYCPVITSPYDLKEKWQKLAPALQKIKNKQPILI